MSNTPTNTQATDGVRRLLATALSPEARTGLRRAQQELAALWGALEDECLEMIGDIAEVRTRLGEDGFDWDPNANLGPDTSDPVEAVREAVNRRSGSRETVGETAEPKPAQPVLPAPPVASPVTRKITSGLLTEQALSCFKRHGGTVTADDIMREVYHRDDGNRAGAFNVLHRMKDVGLVHPVGDRKTWALGREGVRPKKPATSPATPPRMTMTRRLQSLVRLYDGKVDQAMFAKALYSRDTPEHRRFVRDLLRSAVRRKHVQKLADGRYKWIGATDKLRRAPTRPSRPAPEPAEYQLHEVKQEAPMPRKPADEPMWKRALDFLSGKPRTLAATAQHVYGANTTRNRQKLRSMLLALQRAGHPIREIGPIMWGPRDTSTPEQAPAAVTPRARLQRPAKAPPQPAATHGKPGKGRPLYFRCRTPGCGALKFEGQLVPHLVEDHGRLELVHATAASDEVRSCYEEQVDVPSTEEGPAFETTC